MEWERMSDEEQQSVRASAADMHTTSRAKRATIALLVLLIATGLARQFGLLDPILTYGVGGGLACCLLIVQLDRLHTRGQRNGHTGGGTPDHEDRNKRES